MDLDDDDKSIIKDENEDITLMQKRLKESIEERCKTEYLHRREAFLEEQRHQQERTETCSPPPHSPSPLEYIDETIPEPMHKDTPFDLTQKNCDNMSRELSQEITDRQRCYLRQGRPPPPPDIPHSIPEPFQGPLAIQNNPPHCSGRFPIPKIRLDNTYGDKTPAQIENEINDKRDKLREQLADFNPERSIDHNAFTSIVPMSSG